MIEYGRTGNTDLSYRVGCLLFHPLGRIAGPRQFNVIIGGFYQGHATAGGTTTDLVNFAIPQSSGDLRPLFHDWMQTTD
jgi:hypothetical protein